MGVVIWVLCASAQLKLEVFACLDISHDSRVNYVPNILIIDVNSVANSQGIVGYVCTLETNIFFSN